MKHSVYGKKLGRSKNERAALFKNLVRSLFLEEKIQTTAAKASAIKGLVDKIINQAKNKDTRRYVQEFLTDKAVQEKLLNDLTPRLSDRNSGYTSVVRMGKRLGDGTMIVQMSLIMDSEKKVANPEKPVKEVKTAKTKETSRKAKA